MALDGGDAALLKDLGSVDEKILEAEVATWDSGVNPQLVAQGSDKPASSHYDPDRLQAFLEREAKACLMGQGQVPFVKKQTVSLHPEPQVDQGAKRRMPEIELLGEDAELMDLLAEMDIDDNNGAHHGFKSNCGSSTMPHLLGPSTASASRVAGIEFATVKATPLQEFGDDGENDLDLKQLLTDLETENHGISSINLNNHRKVTDAVVAELIMRLATDTQVKVLSLNNCGLKDTCIDSLSDLVKQNRILEEINLETNRLTGIGIISLCRALSENECLRTVRFMNQHEPLGSKAESTLAQLIEENQSLCKFSANFLDVTSRNRVDKATSRNMTRRRRGHPP